MLTSNKTFNIQNTYYKGQVQQQTRSIGSAEALCQTVKPTQPFPSQKHDPLQTDQDQSNNDLYQCPSPPSPSRFAEA